MLTYCGEIINRILLSTKDIELVRSNYTSKGVEAIVKDVGYDGQEYIIKVEPKRR